ncbi:MAG: hypothetical protein HY047_00045 [Acidobacteria bacterium]|nr:hypothetical protein [Acidobacteriota bacterium]
MQRLFMWILSFVLAAGSFILQAAGDTKAAELLKAARAAIGGEKAVANVQGLACSGTVQRVMGDRQVSGELTINVQLPDKMVRGDSISPMGDLVVVTEQGINGDKLLRSSKTLNAPPGAMIRMPAPPAPGSDAETQALRNSRAELARFAVTMLLTAPASSSVEFTYAGEAESPDGKADVLDLKGVGSFAAKLFLDKSNHRPLMLTYRGVAPRVVVQTRRGGPPPSAAPGQPGDTPASEVVDISLFLDDYKSVDGVLLPHHITRSVGGETNEEWTFKTVKVNPAFKAETFSGK